MRNEKIIERAKRLMALAESDNEHEAKLAAERASELLLRYNLSMQQLETKDAIDEESIKFGNKRPTELKFITSILRDFFFIDCFTSGPSLVIVGTPTNIAIASYTFEFLMRAFREGFKNYRKATGAGLRHRQPYYYGLKQGITEQLRAKQRAVCQETGIVVVKDPQIKQYLSRYNLRNVSSGRISFNDGAISAGRSDGKNMNIMRGVGGSRASGSTLYLRG